MKRSDGRSDVGHVRCKGSTTGMIYTVAATRQIRGRDHGIYHGVPGSDTRHTHVVSDAGCPSRFARDIVRGAGVYIDMY